MCSNSLPVADDAPALPARTGRSRVDVLRVGSGTGTTSTGRVYPVLLVSNMILDDAPVLPSTVHQVHQMAAQKRNFAILPTKLDVSLKTK